jgi:hypothetical protein
MTPFIARTPEVNHTLRSNEMQPNTKCMKIIVISIVICGVLSSCITTGHSHLELTLLDKRSHTPLSGASLLAYYQKVIFGPAALPRACY